MKWGDLLCETWYALSANKGRSFLTILGIVIGISAVIAMTALIGGIQNALVGELGFAQARQVAIYAYSPTGQSFDDVDALEQRLPDYEFLTGYTQIGGFPLGTSTTQVDNATIYCVKPEYFTVNGSTLAAGRFFTDNEETSGARYVLLDKTAIPEIFGSADVQAVGKLISIGNDEYEVVGVLESSSLMSFGTTVYLPYTTAQQRLGVTDDYLQITGFLKEDVDIESVVATTTDIVAQYYNLPVEEVSVYAFDSVIKEMETMMASFSLLMSAVASISLFVGGIGIMNMMLTNVTERIREIGLRKSLGARRRDITKQFLLEAIMLCVVGGIVGIFVGLAAAWGLGVIVSMMQPGLALVPALSLPVIVGTVGVCVLIGLVFGYYPARRAAKLDPVESLRYQ